MHDNTTADIMSMNEHLRSAFWSMWDGVLHDRMIQLPTICNGPWSAEAQ